MSTTYNYSSLDYSKIKKIKLQTKQGVVTLSAKKNKTHLVHQSAGGAASGATWPELIGLVDGNDSLLAFVPVHDSITAVLDVRYFNDEEAE